MDLSPKGPALSGWGQSRGKIIRGQKHGGSKGACYPLRGKPIRYTDPFGGVAEEDWEALR